MKFVVLRVQELGMMRESAVKGRTSVVEVLESHDEISDASCPDVDQSGHLQLPASGSACRILN